VPYKGHVQDLRLTQIQAVSLLKTKTTLHVLGISASVRPFRDEPKQQPKKGEKSKSMMNRSYFPASPLSASFKVLNTKTARSASALPVIPRRTHFRLSKNAKNISAQDMRMDEPQGKAREAYVRSLTSASRTRDGRRPPYAQSWTLTRSTHRKDMRLQRTINFCMLELGRITSFLAVRSRLHRLIASTHLKSLFLATIISAT
jgi:hypothetical protein